MAVSRRDLELVDFQVEPAAAAGFVRVKRRLFEKMVEAASQAVGAGPW